MQSCLSSSDSLRRSTLRSAVFACVGGGGGGGWPTVSLLVELVVELTKLPEKVAGLKSQWPGIEPTSSAKTVLCWSLFVIVR